MLTLNSDRQKREKIISSGLLCPVLGLAIQLFAIQEGAVAQKGIHKSDAGKDLFLEGQIPKLQIAIPVEGMSSLGRSPRRYVTATIREGATVYTNVAVHLKGGPGSFRQLQDLPSFTLNFDRFADGQTFHGLKKIHLNNSVQDRSFISEKISRELFEAVGVPAPRAGHAQVTLNGRELGLYVLIEGIDKQFYAATSKTRMATCMMATHKPMSQISCPRTLVRAGEINPA